MERFRSMTFWGRNHCNSYSPGWDTWALKRQCPHCLSYRSVLILITTSSSSSQRNPSDCVSCSSSHSVELSSWVPATHTPVTIRTSHFHPPCTPCSAEVGSSALFASSVSSVSSVPLAASRSARTERPASRAARTPAPPAAWAVPARRNSGRAC